MSRVRSHIVDGWVQNKFQMKIHFFFKFKDFEFEEFSESTSVIFGRYPDSFSILIFYFSVISLKLNFDSSGFLE